MTHSTSSFALGDVPRVFERLAEAVTERWPATGVGRFRDAIELHIPSLVPDDDPVVVILTPELLEVRLPITEWTGGAYGPVSSSRRWRRRALNRGENPPDVIELVTQALAARCRQFRTCRFCRRKFTADHMTMGACHGCAERDLGVVH